jgi:hypothetical protein
LKENRIAVFFPYDAAQTSLWVTFGIEFSCNTEKKWDESETHATSCAWNELVSLRQGDLHQFWWGIPRASVRDIIIIIAPHFLRSR